MFEHDLEEKRERLDIYQWVIAEIDDESYWIEVRYYSENVGDKKWSE